MKIISALMDTVKRIKILRVCARKSVYGILKLRYKIRGISISTEDNVIAFCAYDGKKYACSPKAVYEYMLKDDRFLDYQFIWIFKNPDEYKTLEKNRNTKIVMHGSKECEQYLHKAKYWIFNFRAVDQWIPNKKQIYIQCWHGTPLKRLGYDITKSNNVMNSISEIQSKYKTDTARFKYILSCCKFVSEKFTSAWQLEKFGKKDAVLEIGYPRNDFLNYYDKKDVYHIKEKLGLNNIDKKIILYAPTWRDNQHDFKNGYVYKSQVDFDYLMDNLKEDYIILFRAHYLVADNFNFEKYSGFMYDVSNYDEINDLYIISDLLITDYSSVFFDYGLLKRPILFYMYDMEEYRDELRGFYIDIDELPGPVVKSEKELVDNLNSIKLDEFNLYEIEAFNKKYNNMNDGRASERLANIIIGNSK